MLRLYLGPAGSGKSAEIGRELGISEGAVKTRVFRGRRMLIEQLRKEGYLDGRASV